MIYVIQYYNGLVYILLTCGTSILNGLYKYLNSI